MFPEVVNYPQGIVLINHTPPLPSATGADDKIGAQMAAIATGSRGNFLWRNAICVFPTAGAMPAIPARPTPVGAASSGAGVPGITELFRWVNADQSVLLHPVPVQLQPINGTTAVTGNLLEDSAAKLSLVVWPGADAVLPQDGDFRVPLQGGSVRIIIDNQSTENGYVIAPGSKHQLTITDWGKAMKPGEKLHQEKAVVQADANGQLQIQLTGTSLQIDLGLAA